MRIVRTLLVSIGLAFMFASFHHTVRADEWDKATKVTFGEPVQVPGQILPAGTYYFKLHDSASDRHIVQIFNEDHTHLITTVMAIPNYRLQPADKTILAYAERPADQPPALQAWFYPGDNFGQEFVYPKSEAEQLSKLNNTKVPSTDSDAAYPGKREETAKASESTVTSSTSAEPPAASPQVTSGPDTDDTTRRTADSSATASAGSSYTPATARSTDETNTRTAQRHDAEQLPQTASLLPLLGLASLVLLGAAAVLRVALRS
jgi:hypothetical protein